MATLFSRFPYAVTGDNFNNLRNYDVNSRKKISVLGWFVMVPTLLWFLTAYLAATSILSTTWKIGLLTGTIAALFVFIFERSVVQSKRVHWVLVSLRILLGLCIAIFSSVILDLIFFQNDIQYFAEVQIIQQQKQAVDTAHTDVEKARQLFLKEMDGRGGTGNRGYGPIAKQKERLYNEAMQKELSVQDRFKKMEAGLRKPGTAFYNSLVASLGMNTILNRIKLLHEFVRKHVAAGITWIILMVIGTFFELFCILTKLLSRKTAYELDEEAHEIILANKREQTLQQSSFHLQLGVHGREVENGLYQRRSSMLN